jgi:hypothetical protein
VLSDCLVVTRVFVLPTDRSMSVIRVSLLEKVKVSKGSKQGTRIPI